MDLTENLVKIHRIFYPENLVFPLGFQSLKSFISLKNKHFYESQLFKHFLTTKMVIADYYLSKVRDPEFFLTLTLLCFLSVRFSFFRFKN